MRPKSVKLGEQLYAGSLVLALVLAAMGWASTVAAIGTGGAIGIYAAYLGASILLLILAARGGNRIALWVLSGITAVNLVGFLMQVSGGVVAGGLFGVLTTLQTLLATVAIVLFFRPAARDFFARPHPEWEEDA
ncbi:hypothetical protein [Sphingomonas rubra]|uniref:Integral membrane protein n=1 Tax=Sphingomonas rubra TaxID=634430 RepID=A0A1I5U1C6_9SPHN|nr:hypothetical protein [Sphingomonas rubra]SFP89083.1 hypothetical protein SAMN04488241_11022 [Sphingomonas rubra]